MKKAPESLTGMNVRKRIKEATEKAKDTMKIKHHHHHYTGRQAYESSKGGSSVSTSDDNDTSVHSNTATVKMATISTGSSSNALQVEAEATSKTTTTTKETFVEIHKDQSDFIGLGITSLALVPVLGMMLSKDENGISLSSSVSIPVLLYGIIMGLLAGVFLGRASKDAVVSSTSVVHATEEPTENNLEPELVLERRSSRETTRDTSSKKSPRALSPFQPMREAATKFKGNMKQWVKPWTSLSTFKDGQSGGTHPLWQHPSRSDPFKSSVGPGSALVEQMKNMGIRLNRKKRTQPQAITPGASLQLPAKEGLEGETTPEEEFEEDSSNKFGQIAAKQEDAETLEDVVEPAMELRGIDVFQADPETGEGYSNLGNHPYLVENGLRDVPTLLVNLVTGHGNVIQYLELPSYVTQLHDLVEADTDDEKTKAIKRFINGDDDYRNERFKVLPSVAQAPFAIRVIAPAKSEIIINSTYVKCYWRKHEGTTDPLTGKQLHPLLEVEVDCMSDKWVRSIVNLCIKNMSGVVVDVALVIQLRLDLQDDPKYDMANECQACIGMFRLDRVDMMECPTLPPRGDMSSFSEDELRASKIVGMDLDSLRQLRERAEEC